MQPATRQLAESLAAEAIQALEAGKEVPAQCTAGSSDSDEWYTPEDLFATLNAEFGFTLDPCATPESAKCLTYFTKEDDGLTKPWSGTVFVNPPFSDIPRWLAKSREEVMKGSTVVLLIRASIETKWWEEHIMWAAELRFIHGRLRFECPKEGGTTAPGRFSPRFPSVIVVFRPGIFGPPVVRYVDKQGHDISKDWERCVVGSNWEWEHWSDEEREEAIREQAVLNAEFDRFEARQARLA
ncbi:MAG: DNA N-6-adenine-methyltransferase [Acidimicrobiales bacterium]